MAEGIASLVAMLSGPAGPRPDQAPECTGSVELGGGQPAAVVKLAQGYKALGYVKRGRSLGVTISDVPTTTPSKSIAPAEISLGTSWATIFLPSKKRAPPLTATSATPKRHGATLWLVRIAIAWRRIVHLSHIHNLGARQLCVYTGTSRILACLRE